MIFGEWNMDDALAVRYEEGIDEGIGIGHKKGSKEKSNEILDLIKKGYTVADIEKHLRKQTCVAH